MRVERLISTGCAILMLILAGCSSTVMSGSWKNPEFTGKLHKVYIVGIAKDETVRRMFEDQFNKALQAYGVSGNPSYRDLPDNTTIDKDVVLEYARRNGDDSVMLTRAIGKRTEEVVNPGQVTGYNYGPRGYPGGYYPAPYYRNYGSYYNRSWEMTYEPATITQFQVVTIEANLYDTESQQLIWSAQLETILDGNLNSLVSDFVKTVTEDMQKKSLL